MLRTPTRWLVAAGIIAAALAVTPFTASPRLAAAATVSVDIVDFAFSPAAVTIGVGDTVVWMNTGAAPHTSTSDPGQADAWDSSTLATGQSFSRTFSVPGTFTYFCAIHPFMRASVTVREAPTATATASPTASATPTPTAHEPTSTPEPSETATPTRTATPASPTSMPHATVAVASPPAPSESVPPTSGDGAALAAAAPPPRAGLPSAGQSPGSTAGRRTVAFGAIAILGATGLASVWWSSRRA